jgi:hypothetical protein
VEGRVVVQHSQHLRLDRRPQEGQLVGCQVEFIVARLVEGGCLRGVVGGEGEVAGEVGLGREVELLLVSVVLFDLFGCADDDDLLGSSVDEQLILL